MCVRIDLGLGKNRWEFAKIKGHQFLSRTNAAFTIRYFGEAIVTQETSVQDQTYKQVIVMRHDLKMRRGKQIAQGAHASMAFLSSRLKVSGVLSMGDFNEAAKAWLSGGFAKICCRVESEDELLAIRDQASQQGLEVHLITDSGKTEFHGVPTNTCLAIGPDEASKIDAITGALKLL